jgi:hypothetical protein
VRRTGPVNTLPAPELQVPVSEVILAVRSSWARTQPIEAKARAAVVRRRRGAAKRLTTMMAREQEGWLQATPEGAGIGLLDLCRRRR